ncbi:MFS transporter [Arthrobacter sp. Marseille-P9274]|uniref:MFS transporter n=1 Tax=Arthrobacter sp. Marseille-P9274 TaxID=2866572 RepID=UPI0021C910FA|nr:MFS transporter [Arthrobacter sp. Marseille-P9274]
MSSEKDSTRHSSPVKVALASFIGTSIEYYDFFIFGTAAALVFPQLFFPQTSPVVGTLLAFATLGVGFLARPLGGVLFGHFGDRVGRKKMLVISLVGMGLATLGMGLMPTYAQIGLLAPILLTVLRLFQGLMVGGEWGGAVLMAVEHAPKGRKGFYGSFPQTGAPVGVALATVSFLAISNLPDEQFLSWGWRLPFLASALLVLVGLVIRMSIAESPAFAAAREKQSLVKVPLVEAFKRHPKEIFLIAGTYLSQGVIAYIAMSYLVNYGSTVVGLQRGDTLMGVLVGAVVAAVLTPVFGAVSDTWGRKTVYFLGALMILLTIVPGFMLINSGAVPGFVAGVVVMYGIATAPACGTTGSLFSMVFSREVRYTGASVGYTISQIAGPAFAPMIATSLYAAFGTSDAVVIYLLVIAAISVLSVSLLPGGWGKAEARYNQEIMDRESDGEWSKAKEHETTPLPVPESTKA